MYMFRILLLFASSVSDGLKNQFYKHMYSKTKTSLYGNPIRIRWPPPENSGREYVKERLWASSEQNLYVNIISSEQNLYVNIINGINITVGLQAQSDPGHTYPYSVNIYHYYTNRYIL